MLSRLNKIPDPSRRNTDSWQNIPWQAVAFVLAVAVWIAGMFFVQSVLPQSLIGKIIVSSLPVHVLGTGAVLGVLACYKKRGAWLESLWLRASTGRIRPMLWHTLREVAWVFPLVLFITGTLSYLMKQFGYEPEANPLVEMVAGSGSLMVWITVFVVATIMAPLAEEIQFRTVLYEALGSKMKPWAAAFITATVFAATHRVPVQIPGLLILGLVLQRVREREESLWASIFLHAAYNFIILCLCALSLWLT